MKKIDIGDDIRINFKTINKSLMMIFLLEECDFSCNHCVREDEPMDLGYKLSVKQFKQCLSDCRNLRSLEWVHFSGGEPTLWTEGNLDLVDLLIEISKADFEPGFTSNGNFFNDYNDCYHFLTKYFKGANKTLRLYLSIDTFHHNFDIEKGRAKSLDNIIKFKSNLPPEKSGLIDITLIVVISKNLKSLLPDEMIKHYETLGVKFNFVPLQLKGKAKSFSHLCPDLDSDKPEELGAYYQFHQKKERHDSVSNIVLIGNDYYLPDDWRKVAKLGHLPKKILEAYRI